MRKLFWLTYAVLALIFVSGCSVTWDDEHPLERDRQTNEEPVQEEGRGGGDESPIAVDPSTGIPYATVFQFPIRGMDRTWVGFGFGAYNESFSGKYHLGADTKTWLTPFNTVVVAPADGIVRISTDIRFGYYGSDSGSNPDNLGCTIVLEHMLQNGQAITTLMGHVVCESGTYDSSQQSGNPNTGIIVRRGQYIGHVAHYWHGASYGTDWHHTHLGVRRGRFNSSSYTRPGLAPFVKGYDWASEFTTDASGNKHHPTWLDPIEFVEGHSDPIALADGNVIHHPSGSLLLDGDGVYWIVVSDSEIARLTQDVINSDRYNTDLAVRVSDDEIGCFFEARPIESLGRTYIYRRPFTNTIVIAYEILGSRHDFLRWEVFISWGFSEDDIQESYTGIMWREWFYNPEPDLRLRPGTLVTGDGETEVSIVTRQNTRLPIQSGEIFKSLGYRWDHVVTIPQSVLDIVAGPREDRVFGRTEMVSCPALPSCSDGGTCGGGDDETSPEPDPEPTPDPVEPEPDPEPFCIPNAQINCDCGNGVLGIQVCLDDASGFGACQCSIVEPDPPPPVTDPVTPDPEPDPVSSDGLITFLYEGPVTGEIVLMAWWINPDGSVRGWNVVSECEDTNPNDSVLECELPVLSGSQLFEFQINLPDGTYWGDHSCWSGGCDAPIGILVLTLNGTNVEYTFNPNSSGAPYFNGYLTLVP
jgi:hypothetical protein